MIYKILNALIVVFVGVVGVPVLYFALNALVNRIPGRLRTWLRPYVFVGPALAMVGVFLVYPAVHTVILSFRDRFGQEWVGFSNYVDVATDASMREVVFNNILWIVFVPTLTVAIGLAVAVLADRLKTTAERVVKSVIFLPMAISFVGASTIWLFVYAYRPSGEQIGLLNAVWTLFGGEQQAWTQLSAGNLNDFLLMVIMIWLQAGFAMVLLSAAIKNVPVETLEAARIDGCNEWQIFWQVIVPQVRATILVVLTTVTIFVLKIFDVVYVMTGGNFRTDIVANRFITELLSARNFGAAAVIVVALLMVTVPVMVLNIRRFREEEATR
ncbi:MAG: ABC transporter permease subunit [Streptosporangiales bacterium]|nr:ABC transporter permease subunit [Streptosporangiales bacterium]